MSGWKEKGMVPDSDDEDDWDSQDALVTAPLPALSRHDEAPDVDNSGANDANNENDANNAGDVEDPGILPPAEEELKRFLEESNVDDTRKSPVPMPEREDAERESATHPASQNPSILLPEKELPNQNSEESNIDQTRKSPIPSPERGNAVHHDVQDLSAEDPSGNGHHDSPLHSPISLPKLPEPVPGDGFRTEAPGNNVRHLRQILFPSSDAAQDEAHHTQESLSKTKGETDDIMGTTESALRDPDQDMLDTTHTSENIIQNLGQISDSHQEVDMDRVSIVSDGSLSPPPSSIHSDEFLDIDDLPTTTTTIPRPTNPAEDQNVASTGTAVPRSTSPAEDQNEPPATGRRSFRKRTEAQLRPYSKELEQYKLKMKARGLKPVIVYDRVEEPPRRTHRSVSRADSSQEDYVETQKDSGSQEPRDAPSPRSVRSVQIVDSPDDVPDLPIFKYVDSSDADDDPELPDLQDILKPPRGTLFPNAPNKRRLKSYSTKGQRNLQTQVPQPVSPREAPPDNLDVWDVPPSPPATSSPFPTVQPSREPAPRPRASALSRSSTLDLEITRHSTPKDLPTPEMSSVRRRATIAVPETESEEDKEDSAASSAESSSERDDGQLIRKIGKKIRGVLPASWIRLDQRPPASQRQKKSHRSRPSMSPSKAPVRGVAVPKVSSGRSSTATPRTRPEIYVLSDDSDDGDDPFDHPALHIHRQSPAPRPSPARAFSTMDNDTVMEDNSIDAMLPSQQRKRRTTNPTGGSVKRQRISSTSTFGREPRQYQPRITEHLAAIDGPSRTRKEQSFRVHKSQSQRRPKGKVHSSTVRPPPPRLSILDVTTQTQSRSREPKFIRVAARIVRRRRDLGRRSPTRKFVRLERREDTQTAQETLRDWREGTLAPATIDLTTSAPPSRGREPLRRVSSNPRNKPSHVAPSSIHSHDPMDRSDTPLSVSGENFQDPNEPSPDAHSRRSQSPASEKEKSRKPKVVKRRHLSSRHVPESRPAQLETLETNINPRHPSIAFRSNKRSLDVFYRQIHKISNVGGKPQLARFIADVVAPGADKVDDEPVSVSGGDPMDLDVVASPAPRVQQKKRRRKQPPKRLDVGAATYRQPTMISYLAPSVPNSATGEAPALSMLQHLGPFGTKYTIDFDIFPLPSGVYFHESTFIGSGKLSRSLKYPQVLHNSPRGFALHQLEAKQLRWGPWDDHVSSEIGVCFDWIVQQLGATSADNQIQGASSSMSTMSFITHYIQDIVSFPGEEQVETFVSRMIQCERSLLDAFSTGDDQSPRSHSRVELASHNLALLMLILQIAKTGDVTPQLVSSLMDIVETAATHCVRDQLPHGLDHMRKFYDDLQYLEKREAGIRKDSYLVEAWVILIQVLQQASIPKASFWDIFNKLAMDKKFASMQDARVLEKLWDSMFSLLPLVEMDVQGVVVPGRRFDVPFENWTIPQKIFKRISDIYAVNARQCPSFNNYCEASFTRCFHLLDAWGWRRRSGSIVGTLFDFFASNKLAHLRNEEVLNSPKFLEQLHEKPSVVPEHGDCCFHILLKIIATALKFLRQAGDSKGIQNLIIRITPNHDRRYPKDQPIQERDLASLRNHHDLLCTLFWASPPATRPSISRLRELISPDDAHHAACMIHLQAWTNLSRFTLSTMPTPTEFQPFAVWYADIFNKIASQYRSVKQQAMDQYHSMQKKDNFAWDSKYVQDAIKQNQQAAMMDLLKVLKILPQLQQSLPLEGCKTLLEADDVRKTLETVLDIHKPTFVEAELTWMTKLLPEAMACVDTYLEHVKKEYPLQPVVNAASSNEDDSQDYGDEMWNSDDFRLNFLGPVPLESLVRCMREALSSDDCVTVLEPLTRLLAKLLGLKVASGVRPSELVELSSVVQTFSKESAPRRAATYAPLFFTELLTYTGSDTISFQELGIEMFEFWLCGLAKPASMLAFEESLTESLLKKGYLVGSGTVYTDFTDNGNLDKEALRRFCLQKLKFALRCIFRILDGEGPPSILLGPSLLQETKVTDRIVYKLMSILLQNLKYLKTKPGDPLERTLELSEYEHFATEVLPSFETYSGGSDDLGRLLEDLSLQLDTNRSFDSKLFLARLRGFGLNLRDHAVQKMLLDYCMSQIKSAAAQKPHHQLEVLGKALAQAMHGPGQDFFSAIEDETASSLEPHDLRHEVLMKMTPAFIFAAFRDSSGFYPLLPFLQAAEESFLKLRLLEDSSLAVEMLCLHYQEICEGLWIETEHENIISYFNNCPPTPRVATVLACFGYVHRTFLHLGDIEGLVEQPLFQKLLSCLYDFDMFSRPSTGLANEVGTSTFPLSEFRRWKLTQERQERPVPELGRAVLAEVGSSFQYYRHAVPPTVDGVRVRVRPMREEVEVEPALDLDTVMQQVQTQFGEFQSALVQFRRHLV